MRSVHSFFTRMNMLCQRPPRHVLQDALEILQDPHKRCRSPFAVAEDEVGQSVRPADPSAVRWSVEGAIAKVSNPYGVLPPYFMVLLDNVICDEFGMHCNVPYFEDHYGHAEILRVLELAIERTPNIG